MSAKRKPAPVPIGHCPHCRRTLIPGPPGFRVCANNECPGGGWTETAAPAADTPATPAGAISLPLTRLDAWAIMRALATANDVYARENPPQRVDPKGPMGQRQRQRRPDDETHVRTWVAERLLRLLDPATDAAATVDAHCTGGCGDITITRDAFETGACPFCGRDLDSVEGAHGD